MTVQILIGDALDRLSGLPKGCVHSCTTSPPYFGLRNYGVAGQIGLESSPAAYVKRLVAVFREVRRVMRPDGTLWVNIGDSYAFSGKGGNPGHSKHQKQRTNTGSLTTRGIPRGGYGLKPKDLIGIPWMLAFALRDDKWWLRSAIIWAKPNGMPGSQEDRPTSSYEMIFMLTPSAEYWSDFDAIKTAPRESTLVRVAQDLQAQAGSHRANGGTKPNGTMKAVGNTKPVMMRDVWFIAPASYSDAHFAVMPDEIARRCIAAGCPQGGGSPGPVWRGWHCRRRGRSASARFYPHRYQFRICGNGRTPDPQRIAVAG